MDYETLCAYLDGKVGARRDMPFGADTLVFKVLHRMFALVAWQASPLSISLKADPVDAVILRNLFDAVRPGYHLNKKHWNTVTLDGSVLDTELMKVIDEAYTLVVQRMTSADQAKLKKMERLGDDKEAG
jgi:predicted DNA-binding protein (MmcQ/YjbR family)